MAVMVDLGSPLVSEAPSPRPWRDLSPDLADIIATSLREGSSSTVAGLPGAVPGYAEESATGDAKFLEDVRTGVSWAIERFPQIVGKDVPALDAEAREVYVHLGAGEAREGRGLEVLLGAYRIGGRMLLEVVLTYLDAIGRLELRTVGPLTSSVFAFVDEMSAASADGYADEVDARASERQWRQRRLATLLVEGCEDPLRLESAARAAGWDPPPLVRAALVPHLSLEAGHEVLGAATLMAEREDGVVAILPAVPDETLLARLAPSGVALGPAVPPRDVPRSLRLAEHTAALPPGGSRYAEKRLADLVVCGDRVALQELADRRLSPLLSLRESQHDRLLETLHAWLRCWGRRAEIAAELYVHPQTIGYRMTQLRSVYGDDLQDPQAVFELGLVLNAWAVGAVALPAPPE